MSDIDTRDSAKNTNKSSMWKKLKYALAIIALLNLNEPGKAENIISDNHIPENTEAVQTAQNITTQATDILNYPDIVSNIEKRTGVKLPEGYEDIIRNFIKNHDILKNNTQFIEDFVVKEMQTKRGINDPNQELFIYCAMGYEHDEDLYDGNDGNKERMTQFESVLDEVEACKNRYHEELLTYLEQRSTDAQQRIGNSQQRSDNAQERIDNSQQRIDNAQQRSYNAQERIDNSQQRSDNAQERIDNSQQRSDNAQERIDNSQQRSYNAQERIDNTIKESIRIDSIGIKHMIEFYEIYVRSPNVVKQEDINFSKEKGKKIIADCIKYGIDYKAILLKEVGDPKKVDEILKFYEINN